MLRHATIDATRESRSPCRYFRDASRYIPGGVNSPVRAFRAVGGEPVFIERASGAYVFGHDGRRYIDYVGSWGPMILGHAHPAGRARRAGARRARAVVRRADADRDPARAQDLRS